MPCSDVCHINGQTKKVTCKQFNNNLNTRYSFMASAPEVAFQDLSHQPRQLVQFSCVQLFLTPWTAAYQGILYFFNLCFNLYYFFPLVALGLVCSFSSSLRYKITYLICDLSSFLMYAFTVINCINCMYSYKLPAFIVPHNFWHVVFSFFLSQGVF